MRRPETSKGFIFTHEIHTKEQLFHADGLGWIHSDPKFLIDREVYFDYLVMVVISGILILEQYGQKYKLAAGDSVLMSLFDQHKYYSDVKTPCEILWLHFGGKECSSIIEKIQGQRALPLLFSSDQTVPSIIKKCLLLATNRGPEIGWYMSLYIYEMLIEIMHFSIIESINSNKFHRDLELITKVNRWIEDNMGVPVTLSILSKYLQMSPFHFSRMFHKASGSSPMQYVMEMKIEKAKYFLTYTNRPISAIADELGFADQSHFTRTFKSKSGMSPSHFKRLSTGLPG